MSEEIRKAWEDHRKNHSTFISESEFEHIWLMSRQKLKADQSLNTSPERDQNPPKSEFLKGWGDGHTKEHLVVNSDWTIEDLKKMIQEQYKPDADFKIDTTGLKPSIDVLSDIEKLKAHVNREAVLSDGKAKKLAKGIVDAAVMGDNDALEFLLPYIDLKKLLKKLREKVQH